MKSRQHASGSSPRGLASDRSRLLCSTLLVFGLSLIGCDGQLPFDYVSADDGSGKISNLATPMVLDTVSGVELAVDGTESSPTATVEEGDIYRVLSGSLILSLNQYRGLQIIDFNDVENPTIIGRYAVSGSPVELYVVGDRALVLLNHWQGYSWQPGLFMPTMQSGGVVLSLDLSDPTQPVLTDQAITTGSIRTSRLVRDGGQAALYVAGGGWGYWTTVEPTGVWESRTVVDSFDVGGDRLLARDHLDLGGYVIDIAATPHALLVARSVRSTESTLQYQSQVSIVDIGDPNGSMIEGDSVPISGRVMSQFNMDLHNDVLRIVSSSTWSDRTNYLETFDASEFSQLELIDQVEFGDSQSLFATIFLGNKAFFVTYLRIDPFHAFEIDDDGYAQEVSEFLVSGWNDFFKPVFDDTRLIGIGVNDENGRQATVSLYDISELDNPSPLIAREEIEGSHGWSEARWDHRAFSVLQDSVAAVAEDGTAETGLVLLPFTACCDGSGSLANYGVQIYTFSETTLTLRGAMEHGSPVRRSFLADADLTANLSTAAISFFDTEVPDEPVELGRVDLSVNYRDFFAFGEFGARVSSDFNYTSFAPDRVEIVHLSEHPDRAEPIVAFEIPSYAQLHQVGDLLIAVDTNWVSQESGGGHYETTIDVHDLSDPTRPWQAASLVTDRIQYGYGRGWIGTPIMMDSAVGIMPYYYPQGGGVQAVDDGLVFLQRATSTDVFDCRPVVPLDEAGVVIGEPAGAIVNAMVTEKVYVPCSEYWQSFALEILDLTDPTAPAFAEEPIELAKEDIGLDFLADGSDLWLSFRRAAESEDEQRPLTRYFVRRVDLSTPASPDLDDEINVPGKLLAIEGNSVFTKDSVWSGSQIASALARLDLVGGLAILRAKRTFHQQYVNSILLDGEGHVVVDHYSSETNTRLLSILDADSAELDVLSQSEIDPPARLEFASAGRALFQAGAGVLVFNLDDPTTPYPQAYFTTGGWPSKILVEDRQIIIPANRYGIYAFDLDESNIPAAD